MKRTVVRALIHVIVAAQILLSAPLAQAWTSPPAAGAEMPCADSMPMSDDGKSCPCCPDGSAGVAACLSACTATAGPVSFVDLPMRVTAHVASESAPRVSRARLSDPPLKPPPIR